MEKTCCPICEKKGEILVPPQELAVEITEVRNFYVKRIISCTDDLTDQTDFVQRDITGIDQCKDCCLIFRNPAPTPQEILKRYKEEKYDPEKLEFFYKTYTPHFKKRLKYLKKWLPKDPKILEVGSYAGGFLNACREEGIREISGIDVCDDINIFLKSKNFNISPHPLSDFNDEKNETFDCIAIWNCFDQLPYPKEDLHRIEKLLKPGGILVLRFPNGKMYRDAHAYKGNMLLSRLMCYNNLLGFAFRNGYSLQSIRKLIKNHQFTIADINGNQLISINDQSSLKRWSQIEEYLMRSITDIAISFQPFITLSPWLEIILQKHSTES